MCSMSTGHCSTQAPQFVQSHRTSSETTSGTRGAVTAETPSGPVAPDRDRAETRSKECGEAGTPLSRRTSPSSSFWWPSSCSTICTLEADSMWSRRPMMRSLGERGFWVFHAGHSSWQRPHSVQAYRSRRAFHEKSSIVPTPRTVSSGTSSKSSSLVTGFPSMSMWSAGPRDFVPSALRRVYRLRIATKRCQATPMPVWMPTTVSQVMEVMTLRALTRTIALASAVAEEEAAAAKSAPSQAVRGKCSALAWASRPGVTLKSAYSRPRRATTHAHTMRMTHSTKSACQRVEPRNREARPRGEESRGWGRVRDEGGVPSGSAAAAAPSGSSLERAASAAVPCPARWRTSMRPMMPARPPHAKTSVSHSHGAKWPRRGSVKVWTRSCA